MSQIHPTSSERRTAPPAPHAAEDNSPAKSSVSPQPPPNEKNFWGELRKIHDPTNTLSARTVTALNDGLERAWNQDNPVSWAIARVRCEVLRMTPQQYARAHGLLPLSTLVGLESPRDFASARYNPESISRLLDGWDQLARRSRSPETKQLLAEAIHEVASKLGSRQPSKTYGVLHAWRYEVGPEAFHRLTGLDYKNMWLRSQQLLIPSFEQALGYARALGMIDGGQKPPEIWANPRVAEMRQAWLADCVERKRPVELARLRTVLEAAGFEVNTQTAGTGSTIGLSTRAITGIARFEPVPWASVEPLYQHLQAAGLVSAEDFTSAREAWLADDRARPPLASKELREIAKQQGLTTRDLTDALGITTTMASKPTLPVFRALACDESSHLAPFGVLASLICKDKQLLERFLEKKRHEIADDLIRSGSNIRSPIAIERALWFVDYSQLSYDKQQVQALEWRGGDPILEVEITEAVRKVGEDRAASALAKLAQLKSRETIPELFRSLLRQGGYAPLATKLQTSVAIIHGTAEGHEVPALPRLKEFLRLAGVPLTPRLELDWSLRTAQHEAFDCQTELQRAINCHISELANTRHQFLRSSGIRGFTVNRHLIHLGATGAITPKGARHVLRSLQVEPASAREGLLLDLALGMTVAEVIDQRIRAVADPDGLRAALRFAVDVSAGTPLTDQATVGAPDQRLSRALTFLREMPGVTVADIERALSGNLKRPESQAYRSLMKEATGRSLPKSSLAFVATDNVLLVRQQPALLARAASFHQPSAALALGVLAALAADDAPSLAQHLSQAEAAASSELSALGVPISELAVQMRVWGVRPDDIRLPQKELHAAVWGGDLAVQARALALVRSVALHKTRNSLQRATQRSLLRTPAGIVSYARASLQSGDRVISKEAHVPLGATHAFRTGRLVPTLQQLQAIANLAGISLSREATARWAFAYAESLREAGHSPASRMVIMNILLTQPSPTGSGSSSAMSAVRDFISRAGLPMRAMRRAFDTLKKSGTISEPNAKAILDALQYGQRSTHGLFLAACVSSASMPEAIAAFSARKHVSSKADEALEPLFNALDGLAASTTAIPPLTGSTVSELVSSRAGLSTQGALSGAAADLALLFAGATTDEILAARLAILEGRTARTRDLQERDRDRLEEAARAAAERRRTQAAVTPTEAWKPTPGQLALPFEDRLTLLAQRLRQDIRVRADEVLQLFSRERPMLEMLRHAFGEELAWHVGLLDAFKHPDAALAVMKRQLNSGLVPKEPGKVLFMTHMQWVDDRGTLGKLSEGSIALSFTQRSAPLQPFQPRRS